ncbi:MAG: polysaccharide biosynthesis protein, partial [Lachnospiraceae bacterium]|nr:polysaccharide biosynthesis protein [Lachnospiraceae bacterium]
MDKKVRDYSLLLRRTFLVTYDIAAVALASMLALLLRFELDWSTIDARYIEMIWKYFPVNVVTTIVVFYFVRLYHSLWAFAGITEMQNVAAGCIITSVAQFTGMMLMGMNPPRSYYFLYAMVFGILILLSRFTYRFLRMKRRKHRIETEGIRTMVIGAGEAGSLIIKEIMTSEHLSLKVACVIDDNPDKIGSYIQGVRVVGDRSKILQYVESMSIDQIIIAMPAVKKSEIKGIIDICKETECELKILPGVYQFMTGEVSVSKLRSVEIEDLLGRDPVQVDLNQIMGYVRGKVVLVTGGGGSIGSELCRQIAASEPQQLIIVDIYENNAYDIQQELIAKYSELDLVVLIASVRNTARMNAIFEKYRPNLVYHAAAHKHVPLMEVSPHEAIKNNVFGTWKTVMAADKYGVDKFVLISTDKAVNPTNIMGASKRMCEMIVQTYNKHSETEFVAVRFGNVLGSNGSVIPLFKKQIEMGGPVKVTHPDIIRYFMTIPEAVSLVLEAGAKAQGGEIFVLDMGEPVKILDLAKNLIRLSGLVPDEDIKIEFTGLRPGEKLYEELLMDEEGLQDTENSMIHIGKPIELDEDKMFERLEYLKQIIDEEPDEIRKLIQEIVPTYH